MTAAEHLAEAERLIDRAATTDREDFYEYHRELVSAAIAHSVMAIAIELGVPHPAVTGG